MHLHDERPTNRSDFTTSRTQDVQTDKSYMLNHSKVKPMTTKRPSVRIEEETEYSKYSQSELSYLQRHPPKVQSLPDIEQGITNSDINRKSSQTEASYLRNRYLREVEDKHAQTAIKNDLHHMPMHYPTQYKCICSSTPVIEDTASCTCGKSRSEPSVPTASESCVRQPSQSLSCMVSKSKPSVPVCVCLSGISHSRSRTEPISASTICTCIRHNQPSYVSSRGRGSERSALPSVCRQPSFGVDPSAGGASHSRSMLNKVTCLCAPESSGKQISGQSMENAQPESQADLETESPSKNKESEVVCPSTAESCARVSKQNVNDSCRSRPAHTKRSKSSTKICLCSKSESKRSAAASKCSKTTCSVKLSKTTAKSYGDCMSTSSEMSFDPSANSRTVIKKTTPRSASCYVCDDGLASASNESYVHSKSNREHAQPHMRSKQDVCGPQDDCGQQYVCGPSEVCGGEKIRHLDACTCMSDCLCDESRRQEKDSCYCSTETLKEPFTRKERIIQLVKNLPVDPDSMTNEDRFAMIENLVNELTKLFDGQPEDEDTLQHPDGLPESGSTMTGQPASGSTTAQHHPPQEQATDSTAAQHSGRVRARGSTTAEHPESGRARGSITAQHPDSGRAQHPYSTRAQGSTTAQHPGIASSPGTSETQQSGKGPAPGAKTAQQPGTGATSEPLSFEECCKALLERGVSEKKKPSKKQKQKEECLELLKKNMQACFGGKSKAEKKIPEVEIYKLEFDPDFNNQPLVFPSEETMLDFEENDSSEKIGEISDKFNIEEEDEEGDVYDKLNPILLSELINSEERDLCAQMMRQVTDGDLDENDCAIICGQTLELAPRQEVCADTCTQPCHDIQHHPTFEPHQQPFEDQQRSNDPCMEFFQGPGQQPFQGAFPLGQPCQAPGQQPFQGQFFMGQIKGESAFDVNECMKICEQFSAQDPRLQSDQTCFDPCQDPRQQPIFDPCQDPLQQPCYDPCQDPRQQPCPYSHQQICPDPCQSSHQDPCQDPNEPFQPCICCHCRSLICDNECKTVSKTLDKELCDPVTEMKYFIDSIIIDLETMDHVLNKKEIKPKKEKKSSAVERIPRESYPVTISDVSSLGCASLYIRWTVHDCGGIAGYEIYVDGHLTNRFYSFRHQAGVVANVDVTKSHQIVLRAHPAGQDFPGDSCDCKTPIHPHPELAAGSTRTWSPSVYYYDPC